MVTVAATRIDAGKYNMCIYIYIMYIHICRYIHRHLCARMCVLFCFFNDTHVHKHPCTYRYIKERTYMHSHIFLHGIDIYISTVYSNQTREREMVCFWRVLHHGPVIHLIRGSILRILSGYLGGHARKGSGAGFSGLSLPFPCSYCEGTA